MKVNVDFVRRLVESKDPVTVVADKMLSIWLGRTGEVTSDFYYKGESEAVAFEEFILHSFDEFFMMLARKCVEVSPRLGEDEDTSFVVMDGMSFREGVLIYDLLKNDGYNVKISCGFSSIPSDTQAFREKLNMSSNDFREVTDPRNVRISGDEQFVWSYFPDIMLDKIQVGHAVLSSLEKMYEDTAKIVKALVNKLKANKIVFLSDHGYIRSEAGFVFSVSSKAKRRLQEVFGNKRFVPMDDTDLSDLVRDGYVIEFSGYYMAKSRYVWPVKGRFSIYLHGGLSLMECLTPIIEVMKGES